MYQLIGNNKSPSIVLKYNERLKITYNYYIYHSENMISTLGMNPAYTTFSQFCRLKVVNCYESCKTCNENISGTYELNQCSTCKFGYHNFTFDLEEAPFINCYNTSEPKVQNYYYLDNDTKKFEKCHRSCKSCNNSLSCIECDTGYYYKKEDLIGTELTGLCNNTAPIEYYLNITEDEILYKKCYNTCSTCFGDGDEINNNCITCKSNYTKYPYDSSKCTMDISNCTNYWKINENTKNVECIDECDNYIVHQGNNKNQCVEDCKNYLNPFNIYSNGSLLDYTCNDEQEIIRKYCITLDFCKSKRMHYNSEKMLCQSENTCVNMSDYSEVPLITDELDNDIISERTIIVKYFDFKVNFSEIKNFIDVQINKYLSELKKELETHEYKNGIDLITVNNYSSRYKLLK